jgi:hypothetical protein
MSTFLENNEKQKQANTKSNFPKTHNPEEFEKSIHQFKTKPYPEPDNALTNEIVESDNIQDSAATVQKQPEEEEPLQKKEIQMASEKNNVTNKPNHAESSNNLKYSAFWRNFLGKENEEKSTTGNDIDLVKSYLSKLSPEQIDEILEGNNPAIPLHVAHEIGHVLGLQHSRQQQDRDEFVVYNSPQQASPVQRKAEKEEEPLQKKEIQMASEKNVVTDKPNNTGLPDKLKNGIENLSGYSMDDVQVHYNSDKPSQLNALAYTQGTDIHVAPSQEKHLAHEAWHVVQQKQGRVKPTLQMKEGVPVNDDAGLEKEADMMGSHALYDGNDLSKESKPAQKKSVPTNNTTVQRWSIFDAIKGLFEDKDAGVTSNLTCENSIVDREGACAIVIAEANLKDKRQRVEYYIKWDAECVPVGNHLGQKPATASPGWVLDKSQKGLPIGDRANPEAAYFDDIDHTERNPASGKYYYFLDGIQMPGVSYPPGSKFEFKLVVYGIHNTVIQERTVVVPW